MRKIPGVFLLLLACSLAVWAQSAPKIYIVAKSQTDQPAKAGQASDEAKAAASYLEDQIAEQIQEIYPCSNPTEDKDIAALLNWEKAHQTLDSNDQADLDQVAHSLGARYLISVSATQTGATEYLKASMIDTATGKTLAMQDKSTGGNNTVKDGADLASSFADSLGGILAPKPEGGKTYPVGTLLHGACNWADANYEESSWTDFQWWSPDDKKWWTSTPSLRTGCTARFNFPGKYRSVSQSGRWDKIEKSNVQAEFTISGDCKKH